jgi:hypothetical protein
MAASLFTFWQTAFYRNFHLILFAFNFGLFKYKQVFSALFRASLKANYFGFSWYFQTN